MRISTCCKNGNSLENASKFDHKRSRKRPEIHQKTPRKARARWRSPVPFSPAHGVRGGCVLSARPRAAARAVPLAPPATTPPPRHQSSSHGGVEGACFRGHVTPRRCSLGGTAAMLSTLASSSTCEAGPSRRSVELQLSTGDRLVLLNFSSLRTSATTAVRIPCSSQLTLARLPHPAAILRVARMHIILRIVYGEVSRLKRVDQRLFTQWRALVYYIADHHSLT